MALGSGTMNMNAGGRPSAPTYQIDVSFALDNAYPTGGYGGFAAMVQAAAKAATPALNVGITKDNIVGIKVLSASGYFLEYDKANDKLLVRWCAAAGSPAAQVTNGTDLSAVTVRAVVEFQ